MVRRARLKEALKEVSNVIVREASPAQDARQERTGAKGNASSIMRTALANAGADGLSGGEVNKAILDRGLSVAAADKAKGRLRHAKMVELGEDKRWRLTHINDKAEGDGCGAGRDVVGIRSGVVPGNMKISFQAARSIG